VHHYGEMTSVTAICRNTWLTGPTGYTRHLGALGIEDASSSCWPAPGTLHRVTRRTTGILPPESFCCLPFNSAAGELKSVANPALTLRILSLPKTPFLMSQLNLNGRYRHWPRSEDPRKAC